MVMRVADLDVRPDRVMLDTNVLLAETDEGRAEHHDALTIMNQWAAGDTILCMSGQILRGYLAVATRPTEHNGLGLKPADAVSNVRAIRERIACKDCWPTWDAAVSRSMTLTWSPPC
jgi:predicted nucleic acid-binding protein